MTSSVSESAEPQQTAGEGTAVWIDWGCHLRTHSLSKRLGIDLLEIVVQGGRLRRYRLSLTRTARVIHRERPSIVIATNPSIVLGYFLLLLRVRYRFALISDAHYAGICALRPWPILQSALNFLNRHSDLVIVTNSGHEERLRGLGGHPFVCPDPLPDLSAASTIGLELPEKSVFLICSFDVDEPYETVFAAFEPLYKEGFTLYVSGNYEKGGIDKSAYPWVHFLGFVAEEVYNAHLSACTLVMDLTVLDDCLVCGAYEALAMGKPLILSETAALKSYFADGCLFTLNTIDAIRDSVREAYVNRKQLSAAACRWSVRNEAHMSQRISELNNNLRRRGSANWAPR